MYLLAVNLYEFGQFLQILLWISLPMVLVALLVTTYLHYRKKRKLKNEEDPLPATDTMTGDRLANGLLLGDPSASLPVENGNAYRGFLWMKDKYEQYREQTDRKYEKLKEELTRSENRYLELLTSRPSQPANPSATLIMLSDSSLQEPATVTFLESASQDVTPMEAATQGRTSRELASPDASPQELVSQDNPLHEPALQAPSPKSAPRDNASIETLILSSPGVRGMPDEKDRQIGFLQSQLDQRIKNYHQLEQLAREERVRAEEATAKYLQARQDLQELQATLEVLNERISQATAKVADLRDKLENNTRLLLHIHQELDRSLQKESAPANDGSAFVIEVFPSEDTRPTPRSYPG